MKKYILIIFILFVAVLSFFYFFLHNKFYTVVEGKIYRSAQLTGDDLEKYIKEKDIKSILNLRSEDESTDWYKTEKEIALNKDIQLYNFGIKPRQLPRLNKIVSILDVLLKAQRPILIHCRRGVDRTGLVSAIALLIEEDPPLHIIKNQFSLRYGVLPFYKSVGPRFFEQYEIWLEKTKTSHSKDTFIYWIKNEYIDDKANLIYWIDTINDKRFDIKVTPIMIDNNSKEIKMNGWTFDFRTKSPPDGVLLVKPDNRVSSRAIFQYNRPGVARFFKLGEKYYDTFPIGWEATFKKNDFSNGCYRIYLEYIKDKSKTWNLDTNFKFCLD